MILKCHRFSDCGGGEESIEIPIPKELESDIAQGGFTLELIEVSNISRHIEDEIIWSVYVKMVSFTIIK